MSVYELSSAITRLAKTIFDDKDLQKYIDSNAQINDLVNPASIATELLLSGKYEAVFNRYAENVEFSKLYINPRHIELLRNYFNRQKNIIQTCIIDDLNAGVKPRTAEP